MGFVDKQSFKNARGTYLKVGRMSSSCCELKFWTRSHAHAISERQNWWRCPECQIAGPSIETPFPP